MKEIRQIMDNALSRLADKNLISVAWENKDFDPPANAEYWRAFLLPGEVSAAGLGDAAYNVHVGVYQVDVLIPAGGGWGDASDSASEIISEFKRGDRFEDEDVILTVTRSYPGPAMREDGRFKVPVSISYRAVIPNG